MGGGHGLVFGPLGSSLGGLGGEGEGRSGQASSSTDLMGQLSTGFLPLGSSSGRLGGPLLFGDGGGASLINQP